MTVLQVRNLDVTFDTADGPVPAVRGLRFDLNARETLGLVGESGSGKTQAVLAMIGLLAGNGRAEGSVLLDGEELLNRSQRTLARIRGRRIAMVFQDPMTSLNPHLSVRRQLELVLRHHRQMHGDAARAEILRMLDAVRLPQATRRLTAYPHEFSGGMRQRIMLAAALLCRPEVLIADEPTTSLDVTVQASILALLRELRDAFGTAVILISHDLGVVAGNCDRLVVMHEGVPVEDGATDAVFASPSHDCTRELIGAVPRLDVAESGRDPLPPGARPVLELRDLSVRYELPRRRSFARRERFTALADVDLDVAPGETVGIVGESGCGKSTLARAITRLVVPESGTVCLLGRPLERDRRAETRRLGRDLQIVFQDPVGSLNPRMTIGQIVAEPLGVHRPDLGRAARNDLVAGMLAKVGLGAETINRYPHEFSGGQCQRAGIARALITSPRLLICDEALSALDVSVQSGIIDLLLSLQQELGLAMVFIAHDLAVVRRVSHRVAVMYLGRIVELAPARELYRRPRHPYTHALLDAAPIPDPVIERGRVRTAGAIDVPAPWQPPSGCPYRTRCPRVIDQCERERPELERHGAALVACHRAGERG